MTTLAMFGMPGGMEMVIILIIGLLLFGRRLPEVGRSLGRSIVEFKKGVKGIEDEIDSASTPTLKSGAEPSSIEGTQAPEQESRTVSRETQDPAASS